MSSLKEMARRQLDGLVSADVFLIHVAMVGARLRSVGDVRADFLLASLRSRQANEVVARVLSVWLLLEIDDI